MSIHAVVVTLAKQATQEESIRSTPLLQGVVYLFAHGPIVLQCREEQVLGASLRQQSHQLIHQPLARRCTHMHAYTCENYRSSSNQQTSVSQETERKTTRHKTE